MIGAGELSTLGVLERKDETSDGQGGLAFSEWIFVGEDWFGISPLSARERLQASGQLATVTHRIRLRWRDDLTARMRLVVDGRYFLLEGPPRDLGERREVLEFLATEAA